MGKARFGWERIRAWDWRWVGVFAIATVPLLVYLGAWRDYDRAGAWTCRDAYAHARTALDSAGVDALTPIHIDPKVTRQIVSCRTLRRLGQLRRVAPAGEPCARRRSAAWSLHAADRGLDVLRMP